MTSKKLFENFKKVSSKEWKQKIQVDLKGVDYQTLITKTLEGIDLKPFYHYDDFISFEQLAPSKFIINQELFIRNEKVANSIARKALEKGAESFTFYFDKTFDIPFLLNELPVNRLVFKPDMLDTDFILELYQKTGGKASILLDPIGHFARYGNWYQNETKDFEKLSFLKDQFDENFKFIDIRTDYYKNGGANITQELAYALAHAVEYAEKLGDEVLSQINFNLAQGHHYFFEIAKLKALRSLWQLIGQVYEQNVTAQIYAVPSKRNKTIFDPYVNMLRSGMEMMSAIIGGADIIANMPFDAVFKKTNEFSERIARNQLIVLKNEANFEEALKSTDGNYFIEENTAKLAEKALDIFKSIEKSGGFLAQLYKGKIQQKIKESADKEQEEFDEQKRILVGTNKYQNTKEAQPEIDFYPFMKKRKGQTLIQPVIPKRLAEKTEQQRLKELGISF